ncbi:MAG: hypothetical protein ACYTFA_16760 [Planctomycetota bacterium]
MSKFRSLKRLAFVVVSGGCLVQVAGCASGLLPVALSFIESAVLSLLTSRFLVP